jgi:hypothetical protein
MTLHCYFSIDIIYIIPCFDVICLLQNTEMSSVVMAECVVEGHGLKREMNIFGTFFSVL